VEYAYSTQYTREVYKCKIRGEEDVRNSFDNEAVDKDHRNDVWAQPGPDCPLRIN